MGRRARELSNTGLYHVIVRGINKEHIFETPGDYHYLNRVIEQVKEEFCFSIYAYCFMSNHIHLLIKEKNQHDLSKIMKKIFIRYAMYFNKKYSRSGSLVESRFKSKAVEIDEYLFPLITYIHKNPVKAGIENIPEHYPYSSCKDYFANNQYGLTDINFVLNMTTIENLKKLHKNELNIDSMLEIVESRKRKQNCEKGLLVKKVLGELSAFEIQGLNKELRNQYIRKLNERGLSIREIGRLTGISKGVIEYCVK